MEVTWRSTTEATVAGGSGAAAGFVSWISAEAAATASTSEAETRKSRENFMGPPFRGILEDLGARPARGRNGGALHDQPQPEPHLEDEERQPHDVCENAAEGARLPE